MLLNAVKNIFKTNIQSRFLSLSTVRSVKEVQEKKEKDALILEGVIKESPRSGKMLKEACEGNFCPECTLGLDIKHTDVLILSQYLRSDGCMLPRRITKLCHRQQKRIGNLVTMAQKAGLMPNIAPHWSKKDPKKRFGWRKFNKYYLEQTIKY